MKILNKIFETLIRWGESINSTRKNSSLNRMY